MSAAPHRPDEDLTVDPEGIDLSAPAEMFWSTSARRLSPRGTIRYLRFDSLAAAVRDAMADTSGKRHRCSISTQTHEFAMDEIAALYEGEDFPRDR